MIFCDRGIVLWRRPLRENDRIVTVYTEERGKLEVNFKSVRLPKGKLKALSEPISFGDYRFFLKNGSNFPVCTGGKTLSVFPGIRRDMDRMVMALYCCEVVSRLTPAHSPSAEKYELLLGALRELDAGGLSRWMRYAFALRVMECAGFGLRHTASGLDAALWETLHAGAWAEVHALKGRPGDSDYLDNLLARFFEEQIGQRLKTEEFF
ncbi:MAG: DNA repair protein RecO [Elusimicrobia bacterium RIFOXYB2_FULL_62_6]|nr:MAG: DNA repair protein RecO [Elusimicrobia bacterium RIFOXYB2_FULL_62_6]